MARASRRSNMQAGELNLTAMIDVAFQLLAFFILTIKPVDVLAHLAASRVEPSAQPAERSSASQTAFSIKILPDGSFALNDRACPKEQLANSLAQVGEIDPESKVLVACSGSSPHASLCEVLDLCAKAKLRNIAILSMQ